MLGHLRAFILHIAWQDSNVAGGEDINRNLKSFAARRTDIFGDQEVAIGEVVGKSAEQASCWLFPFGRSQGRVMLQKCLLNDLLDLSAPWCFAC